MRAITKGTEPTSLTMHRQTPHCDYENYADKNGLRHSLVTEQRGLCCYCMGRIPDGDGNMKVEHWHCQNRHPGEKLIYRNLLGACWGGEGQPSDLQHCDTRKGSRDLKWNPANPSHHIETRVRYELDGTILSNDAAFDAQLNDVLNLNLTVHKNNRKSVLDALLCWWKSEKRRLHGPVPRGRLERECNRRVGGQGLLTPYCQVAVWWLEQRLGRVA